MNKYQMEDISDENGSIICKSVGFKTLCYSERQCCGHILQCCYNTSRENYGFAVMGKINHSFMKKTYWTYSLHTAILYVAF